MIRFGANQVFQADQSVDMDDEAIEAILSRSATAKVDDADGSGGLSLYDTLNQSLSDFDASIADLAANEFEGKVFVAKSKYRSLADDWVESISNSDKKRSRTATTVQIGQYQVLRENNYDMESELGRPLTSTYATTLSITYKQFIENEAHCLYCHDGGELYVCSRCPRSFHKDCLGLGYQQTLSRSSFVCPQHQCYECSTTAADAGGMLFRCAVCPIAACENHLPPDIIALGFAPALVSLEYKKPNNAYYILCSPDCQRVWSTVNDEYLKGPPIRHEPPLKYYKGFSSSTGLQVSKSVVDAASEKVNTVETSTEIKQREDAVYARIPVPVRYRIKTALRSLPKDAPPLMSDEDLYARLDNINRKTNLFLILYHMLYGHEASDLDLAYHGVLTWNGLPASIVQNKHAAGLFYQALVQEMRRWRIQTLLEICKLFGLTTQNRPKEITSGINAGRMSHTSPRPLNKDDNQEGIFTHLAIYLMAPLPSLKHIETELLQLDMTSPEALDWMKNDAYQRQMKEAAQVERERQKEKVKQQQQQQQLLQQQQQQQQPKPIDQGTPAEDTRPEQTSTSSHEKKHLLVDEANERQDKKKQRTAESSSSKSFVDLTSA